MIRLNKMDGKEIVLNAEWIQTIESTPDTLITLTNGEKIMVLDTVEEVISRFKAYKQDLFKRETLRVVNGGGRK